MTIAKEKKCKSTVQFITRTRTSCRLLIAIAVVVAAGVEFGHETEIINEKQECKKAIG